MPTAAAVVYVSMVVEQQQENTAPSKYDASTSVAVGRRITHSHDPLISLASLARAVRLPHAPAAVAALRRIESGVRGIRCDSRSSSGSRCEKSYNSFSR